MKTFTIWILGKTFFLVTPAQAGVQWYVRIATDCHWIPACAGMTDDGYTWQINSTIVNVFTLERDIAGALHELVPTHRLKSSIMSSQYSSPRPESA